jgi:hypothetical protein
VETAGGGALLRCRGGGRRWKEKLTCGAGLAAREKGRGGREVGCRVELSRAELAGRAGHCWPEEGTGRARERKKRRGKEREMGCGELG